MSTVWHEEETLSLLCDLPPGQDRALLHLLTCPSCRDWVTRRLLQEQEIGETLRDYDEVLARVQDNLPALFQEAQRRRAEAEETIEGLLRLAPGERLQFLGDPPKLQPVDLLEASQQAQPYDLERSQALATVAVELTAHLFCDDADEEIAALYLSRAAILEGNAYRLSGDVAKAEEVLLRASFALTRTFDSWDRAEFCRVFGLVRWEQGRLEEAAALLRQSAAVFREQCAPEEEGASHVLAGLLCREVSRTEGAIRLLEAGRAVLDPDQRPWLTVLAGLSLALAFAEVGLKDRAQRILHETRWHYGRVEDDDEQLRIHWLEGKIFMRLEEWDEAETLLTAVRRQLLAEGHLPEAVLCSLDLAALSGEIGRLPDAEDLLQDLEWAFPSEPAGLVIAREVLSAFSRSVASKVPASGLDGVVSRARRLFRARGIRVDFLPFA